jgi:WD40 repeat protein
MTKRVYILLFLCLFIFQAVNVLAQQPPDSINTVLSDLSQRLGETVTFENLDNWLFSGETFPDSSLGCPQPGQLYSQVLTSGVQFLLEYKGVSYDYRVSADGRLVILCSSTEVVPPCPPPDDPAYLPTRLSVGTQARVAAIGIPNNIRQQPGSSSQLLGEIPPGATFNIVGGPSCSTLDKIVWWRVDYNGINGWTAEGQDQEYWLEPPNLTGTLTPTSPSLTLQGITPANAAQIAILSNPQDGTGIFAIAPTGQTFAIATQGGFITLYDLETNIPGAPISVSDAEVTGITFGMSAAQFRFFLATGDAEGGVGIWELGVDNSVQAVAQFQDADAPGAIMALAFSNDGALLAVGDENGSIYLLDVSNGALLTTLTGHTAAIERLGFAGDALYSTDQEGGARVWGVSESVG